MFLYKILCLVVLRALLPSGTRRVHGVSKIFMLSTPLLVVRKSYQVTATEACLHGYRMLLSLLLSPCSNKNLHDILAKSLREFYFHLDSCIISAYDLLCSMPMTKVTWQFSSASALL